MFDKQQRFGIRTLSLGVCSVLVGLSFGAVHVAAEEAAAPAVSEERRGDEEREVPQTEEEILKQLQEWLAENADVPQSNQALEDYLKEAARRLEEAIDKEEDKSSTPKESLAEEQENQEKEEQVAPETKDQAAPVEEAGKQAEEDFPEIVSPSIRPREVKFDTWEELLQWQPGKKADDAINRASVPLAERHQGELINARVNPDAKVQSLANTNSKAENHASVGGEEFKAYAFDFWQYVDSMVFWDGLVPSPDVIDAAHRNGVPIYGNLFFNWSTSLKDQERLMEAMKQDEDGSFPIAKKLVDIAKYYGYDGYFINQETGGSKVAQLPEKIRDFMIYMKEYGKSIDHPVKVSWYDAMTNSGTRYYVDGVNSYNDLYVRPVDGKNPADSVFANFNWNERKNTTSVEHMKAIGRSPYEVFAGFELQKGGSYEAPINWSALIDKETGKLRMSLGLYSPDTILGLAKTGEGFHEHENKFWTGFQGNPTGEKPEDERWYGIANFIADRTPIIGTTFNTYFNTGHGKKWFVDGEVSKDSEWNYRSVSGILPTWRWWVNASKTPVAISYDFEDAYNGGNSLAFKGDLEATSKQQVMLYSTKLDANVASKLRLSYKGGEGAKVKVGLATSPDYKTFVYKDVVIENPQQWQTQTIDLADLAGQRIYGIQLAFDNEKAVADYQFHLGQLAIFDKESAPSAPSEVRVTAKVLKNSQEAEAVIAFEGNQEADYYEVYQKNGDSWKLLTGSSNTTIYLPKVSRTSQDQGTSQELKVLAVGKNGVKSEAGVAQFDWGLTVSDTTLPKPPAPNIVLGAVVTGKSYFGDDGNEEALLNGTLTDLTDKWCVSYAQASVDIRLTQPRNVVRWVVDHAGAGGESVNDGLMNTKDFDLYYKDENGEWQLAKAVRGNKAHISDITLDQPITAQEWRLKVITADNGTPWKAIRIYNWKMYEELDTETTNVPMENAAARDMGNHHIQVGFKDVPADSTVYVYDSPEASIPLASLKSTGEPTLVSDVLRFDKQPRLLYYRTQAEGKDLSNVLAILVPQEEKEITSMTLEQPLDKMVYQTGEGLSLEGGRLRVQYKNGQEAIVPLTNRFVTVAGFDATKLGKQELAVTYLGQELSTPLAVYLAKDADKDSLVALELVAPSKVNYKVGEGLVLDGAQLTAVFGDGHTEVHDIAESGVVVTGYDANKEGTQTLTLSYRGADATFAVTVQANKDKLLQTLEKVQAIRTDPTYTAATMDKKALFDQQLTDTKALLANEMAHQADIERATEALIAAFKGLDGHLTSQTTSPSSVQPIVSSRPTTPSTSPGSVSRPKPVAEDQIVGLVHEASKIQVLGKASSLNGATALKVMPRADLQVLDGQDYDGYDISLVNAKGEVVAIQGEVTVVIPSRGAVDKVYYILGEMTESLPFVQNADQSTVMFKVSHFSQYALVYSASQEGQQILEVATPAPEPSNTLLSTAKDADSTDKQTRTSEKAEKMLPQTGEQASVLTALGLGTLLAATFVGRKKEQD